MPSSGRAKIKSVPKIPKNAKYLLAPVLIIGLVIAIALGTSNSDNSVYQPTCGIYRKDRVIRIGSEIINAEVASSPDERAKGLAGRPCILPSQGMLFEFAQTGQHPFWMKGMKFPIDVVWIGQDFKVASIEIDLQPSTYPAGVVNKKENPAKYVLELKANRTKELRVSQGTTINF